ncbi:MAG: ATP-binding cassette domain-containing protein [Saprospiraceae bacterium]|nr:ATP-binding cassette domain-containing protein [Saprospiraceae bacterium]
MTPDITPVQRFFRLLALHTGAIRDLYIFAALSGIIALTLPLGIQAIINLIQGGEISASWLLLIFIVLAGYTFNGYMQIYQLRITETLQKDIFTRSAFEFTFRIPRIKMKELHDKYAPELMNRFFDTISIQKGLSKVLIEFSTSALQIIFGLILLSFYHPFFIIFSIMLLLMAVLIGTYIFQRGLRSSLIESKYKYKVAHWLEELARTNATFRLTCDSMLPLKKTDALVTSYLEARENHFQILLRQYYLFILFKILVAASFLIMGGILVFNQQMNIGQFVAAEIVVLLLISSSEKLLLTLEVIYDLLTSIEKVGQVTDLELEEDKGLEIKPTDDMGFAVNIRNVSFKFPDSHELTLSDCNLDIAPGEKICITGSNGSGKSTLLTLMTGLYEPDSGAINYNGLPMKNYNISVLRSMIAECVSDDSIFYGSLLENFTLGKNIPLERIMEVCNSLGLDEFLQTLPLGLDTIIGPSGRKISKTITRKIIIARNILKNPRLLMIDDFLGEMEESERKSVLEYITDPSHHWTLIVISKDPSIFSKFERVVHIEDGRIL